MPVHQSVHGGARVRFPPPLFFVLAIAAGAILPGLRWSARLVPAVLGAALVLAGFALGAWAVVLFRRTGQEPEPWRPSPELVLRGPFRFTRNPMYVGMTLITLGVSGLAGRGWIALLAPLALCAVHLFAVLPEEAYLGEKFGEPYRRYLAQVRRYL